MMRVVLALCVTLMCVVALGELAHDHGGSPLDTSTGCSSCALAVLAAIVPTTLAFAAQVEPQGFRWVTGPELLPAGVPIWREDARAPPRA